MGKRPGRFFCVCAEVSHDAHATPSPKELELKPAGYSGTSLVKKLGIKPGFRMAVVDPPPNYWQLLTDLPDVDIVGARVMHLDFLHVVCNEMQGAGTAHHHDPGSNNP